MAERRQVRCAVYTRKSSEEGLEQSFNSLDAQRESCAAYIASQRHEGWRPIRTHYDDGGYSGGTLDRPALQQLLSDIQDHRVDLVVVYKVDRLTRSLIDFAKIIETLDAHDVSFVSVTQSFNTTTSMGRLTLNVLLSFAQFEREVTGERIRDKIAASKRKGLWMGGLVPLGYERKERTLVVNQPEARTVVNIYERYLELGCVRKLRVELTDQGLLSKQRTHADGRRSGGMPFSRGALYTLLRNRIYRGEIRHRKDVFPGQHPGIVPIPLWDQVNAALDAKRAQRREGRGAKAGSLLAGMIFDGQGNRLTPSHAIKAGQRYRYYVASGEAGSGRLRLPAAELESFVARRLQSFLSDPNAVLDELGGGEESAAVGKELVAAAAKHAESWATGTSADLRACLLGLDARFVAGDEELTIDLDRAALRNSLSGDPGTAECAVRAQARIDDDCGLDLHSDRLCLTVAIQRHRRGNDVRWTIKSDDAELAAKHDLPLIRNLARGRRWYEELTTGRAHSMREIAQHENISERYVSRTIHGALIAPDLIQRVLEGRQPAALTVTRLRRPLSLDWNEQRRELGISTR